ncbi:MAG: dihydroorotate dehydrogenase [Candidatus Nitrosocosmicus sp.]
MDDRLHIEFAGITLNNPLIIASGFLGLSKFIFDILYKLGAGAIVSKSISILPREGYKNPTIVSLDTNSYINAVGLANPGLEFFFNEISNNKVPLFVSVVGSTYNDFTQIVNKLKSSNILGFELNLSCPHVEKMGMEIGDDPDAVYNIVNTIKKNTKKPLFVKVGIGKSDIVKTAKVAEEAGADGITAINTVRAMKIDIETGYPLLENKIGGLSGASIKPIGIRCVYEIKKNVNIPIIGCGGVLSHKDAIEYLMAGASAIQIGSILGLEGLKSIDTITKGIYRYLKLKKYKSISDLVGIAQRY